MGLPVKLSFIDCYLNRFLSSLCHPPKFITIAVLKICQNVLINYCVSPQKNKEEKTVTTVNCLKFPLWDESNLN